MNKKKNFTQLLKNLHEHLSSDENILEFKAPFKTQGISTLFNLLSEFSSRLSKILTKDDDNHKERKKDVHGKAAKKWGHT